MNDSHDRPVATARESVRTALSGRWPGRLLRGELVIDEAFVRDFVGLEEEAISWAAQRAVLRRLKHDLVVVPFAYGWGSPLQPDLEEARVLLRQWHQESDLFVFALIDGPFSGAARAWGWQETLIKLAQAEVGVERFMAEGVVELTGMVERLAASGADGILLGDDIAYRRGPYVNPEHLRRSYFPFLTALVDAVQGLGLPVVFHSDGNLWSVLDDLVASGVDGLQGLEPGAGMGLARVREQVGADLCLWGNVDVGWLAQPRPAAEIELEVQALIAPLAGTPLILGTSGGLMAGLPGANVEVLARVGLDG